MDAVPPAPPPSPLTTAWPRSAQLTTAFLLGLLTAILGTKAAGSVRWNAADGPRDLVVIHQVDLNEARHAELLQLPGVGEALAGRIEDYRRDHGSFRNVNDLRQVHGVGPTTLEKLRPWVRVRAGMDAEEAAAPTKPSSSAHSQGLSKKAAALTSPIDVNHASVEELQRLPGVGPKLAQRILDERGKRPFATVEELRRVSGIGAKTLEKLRPFVRVESGAVRVAIAD